MTTDDPNRQAQELGDSLAKARKAAKLTGAELAERAGWSAGTGKTKVSKIERGNQLPTEGDLDDWADATGVDDRLRAQWKRITQTAGVERSPGYAKRMESGQAAVQREYTDRAEETTSFKFFETFVIPRYLQVPQYTRAVLEEYRDKIGVVDDVDGAVKERQRSVRYLYDDTKNFTFLIEEPVLRRRRFPPAVMRAQLHSLLTTIGLDQVTIAVYPSLSRPVHTLTESSFEIFDDIAFVETVLEDDKRLLADDVIKLEALFDRYWRDAAVNEDARPIILDAIEHLPED